MLGVDGKRRLDGGSVKHTRLPGRGSVALNLALQGGGAHGSFTWGVLDALLEDGRWDFRALSGSSAGAINAVLLAQGLQQGGADAAREQLQHFWTRLATCMPASAATHAAADAGPASPLRLALQWTQVLSPYQFNPLDLNPLRDLLEAIVDFDRLRQCNMPQLYIAAAHAGSGQLRLFRNAELTLPALLASTCLPNVHRAVEIGEQPYWDGGFAANPALLPLIFDERCADTLLVLLSPLHLGGAPRSAEGIRARMVDLAFGGPLGRELQLLREARRRLSGRLWPLGRLERRLMRSRLHCVDAGDQLRELGEHSRWAIGLGLFHRLRDQGRERAQRWMREHGAAVGRRATMTD
jgi:NTE family protein